MRHTKTSSCLAIVLAHLDPGGQDESVRSKLSSPSSSSSSSSSSSFALAAALRLPGLENSRLPEPSSVVRLFWQ